MILDIAPAQQHLWTVAKAAFGESRPAAATWVRAPLRALERGQTDRVLQMLDALAQEREQSASAGAVSARKTRTYFTQRRAQTTYPAFVADGYQIGSGLAESTCKRFGTDRMKGTGMRWTVAGAQQVATLRMFIFSERWDEVAARCRSRVA